jgi:uncharacterized RDD family membrane protein YckC
MNWYYVEAGRQAGPVTEAEFSNLVSIGRIQPDTLVWREGMANWQPCSVARAAAPVGAPPIEPAQATEGPSTSAGASGPEVVCAECGKIFSRDNAISYGTTWICAGCKPIFVQKFKEGAALPTASVTMAYAGFWIRFGAKMIDGLIFAVILGIPLVLIILSGAAGSRPPAFGLGLQVLIQFLSLAVAVSYNTFFLGKFGATLGKMACQLKVVTADGAPISYLRAFGRAWAEQLSGLVCYVGYIIAAFDSEKRALHDHICNTRVIRK